ncbi:MAG: protein kinase [Myxococcota bacterium]
MPTSNHTTKLPLTGAVVGGSYRLGAQLGCGEFGAVYAAQRVDVPEHRVALKLTERAAFGDRDVARELVMLAATNHPHVVQLKDHGVTADYVWHTMPLYEGETLAERIARRPLELRAAYELFVPLARGLAALHHRGLRHQDLKPQNIFLARLDDAVHPLILDLGAAVEADSPVVAGTLAFAAPEQAGFLTGLSLDGEVRHLGPASDVYGLAATLLCCIVGETNYAGLEAESPFAVAKALDARHADPLPFHAIPTLTGTPRLELKRAFRRWLNPDPALRPDARTFARELGVLLESERDTAREIESTLARQRREGRRLRVALVGLGALIAGGGGVGYHFRQTLRTAAEIERLRDRGASTMEQMSRGRAKFETERAQLEQDLATSRQTTAAREASCRDQVANLDRAHAEAERAFGRRLRTVNNTLSRCKTDRTEDRNRHGRDRDAWSAERRTLERDRREARTENDALQRHLERETRARKRAAREAGQAAEARAQLRRELETLGEGRRRLEAELASIEGELRQARETPLPCAERPPRETAGATTSRAPAAAVD